MANLTLFSLAIFLCCSLLRTTQAHDHEQNGLSFRLIHRHSLESPSCQQTNLTVREQTEKLIHLSQSRVEYLESLIDSKSKNTIIRPHLHLQSRHGAFLIQVGIGTFSSTPAYKTSYLELDTASGVIWTQCEGCNPCFHQRDPVFPRSQSRTYRALPCNRCPHGTTCQRDHCMVDQEYEDGTRVQGILATETFWFGSNANRTMLIPNLRFACVIHTRNYSTGMDPNNIASGIFGMNPQPSSFTGQVIRAYYGGRFSYCLTPVDHRTQRPPMFLRFGDDIPHLPLLHRGRTPLLQAPTPLYYLDLRAISLGSERLNINLAVFRIRQDGSGGCFIDSGAAVSHLINVAYTEFVRVLKRKTEEENPGITMTSESPQLCYKQPRSGARTRFPKLTFHFANGANFVVEQEAYMLGFARPNPQEYCLTIGSSNRFTVIGSYQQVNHRITYDIVNSQLQFATVNCLSHN